jgi:DNA polymerase-1
MGCDADGLEMRLLSHALFPFDNGAFYESAFNGSKEDGTDCHSKNMNAINEQLQQLGINVTVNREA